MFDVFRLSCLDYLIWLRSGQEAAKRLNCNQATISRNANLVAEFLDLDPRKLEGEWCLGGDLDLLNAERKVHQFYRWSYGRSLRIDGVYGVGSPYFPGVPVPWVCGPSNFLNVNYRWDCSEIPSWTLGWVAIRMCLRMMMIIWLLTSLAIHPIF